VALTVAGQWRNFTAFPSILTIAVLSWATYRLSSSDVINLISMISSFMAEAGREVKKNYHHEASVDVACLEGKFFSNSTA
jgi:hypothetical protein